MQCWVALLLKVTCYVKALSTEKSNALKYWSVTTDDGKFPLRLVAYVGCIAQTARSWLYIYTFEYIDSTVVL